MTAVAAQAWLTCNVCLEKKSCGESGQLVSRERPIRSSEARIRFKVKCAAPGRDPRKVGVSWVGGRGEAPGRNRDYARVVATAMHVKKATAQRLASLRRLT
ncbi:unnamed protein product [Pleuronectes platessa]|uniref:Uncharacterized protein n=1 Tax=Pleuronectes platessa TaxID=8262 RepID=A0A9N7VXA5_PLEPL|nr:unnamed protein product [Pleuronectes platessa]